MSKHETIVQWLKITLFIGGGLILLWEIDSIRQILLKML